MAGFRGVLAPGGEALTSRQAETQAEMMHLFRAGAGNEGATAFDFLNAVTDWVDHGREFRERGDVAERRFLYAALGGEGDRLKSSAFRAAKVLAEV